MASPAVSAVTAESSLTSKLVLGLGVVGLAGYLFWFDQKRRSAPSFKDELREKRRAEKRVVLQAQARAQQAQLQKQRAAQAQIQQAQGGPGGPGGPGGAGGMPGGPGMPTAQQQTEIMQTIQLLHQKGMEKIEAAGEDQESMKQGVTLLVRAVAAAQTLGAADTIASSIFMRLKQGGHQAAAAMYHKALQGDPNWAA